MNGNDVFSSGIMSYNVWLSQQIFPTYLLCANFIFTWQMWFRDGPLETENIWTVNTFSWLSPLSRRVAMNSRARWIVNGPVGASTPFVPRPAILGPCRATVSSRPWRCEDKKKSSPTSPWQCKTYARHMCILCNLYMDVGLWWSAVCWRCRWIQFLQYTGLSRPSDLHAKLGIFEYRCEVMKWLRHFLLKSKMSTLVANVACRIRSKGLSVVWMDWMVRGLGRIGTCTLGETRRGDCTSHFAEDKMLQDLWWWSNQALSGYCHSQEPIFFPPAFPVASSDSDFFSIFIFLWL